ncbi:uncharacterized protein LOC121527295 isoform X1 [Xyrichtys novacula]|uniref:Uncharacterized protein LOC121527295 isoform X1 n=1 Tax=Xyrichtys novacula TaxID=13765 RepID=A0AAV1H8J2_XYRNO|nr:uncharacterized protein LOC121527295 isoform X1 [Xyrichtys novacula]
MSSTSSSADVNDFCRLCKAKCRVNGVLSNTKPIWETSDVFQRLEKLGVTLRRDVLRSCRICTKCFRLIQRIEQSFLTIQEWKRSEEANADVVATEKRQRESPSESPRKLKKTRCLPPTPTADTEIMPPRQIKTEDTPKEDLLLRAQLAERPVCSSEEGRGRAATRGGETETHRLTNSLKETADRQTDGMRTQEEKMSSEHLVVGGVPAGGMDGITMVRIDDTHMEQSDVRTKVREGATAYYEMGYTLEGEEAAEEEEEEEDSVYVIEYSNPEEEGQSYQFTMSLDRSLPPKKLIIKQSVVRDSAKAALPVASNLKRPRKVPRRIMPKEEEDVKKEAILFS